MLKDEPRHTAILTFNDGAISRHELVWHSRELREYPGRIVQYRRYELVIEPDTKHPSDSGVDWDAIQVEGGGERHPAHITFIEHHPYPIVNVQILVDPRE